MDEYYSSEQLEEGEIVDDDDFEAISDNSIIDTSFGKFVSSNENLRALSLSSDSETDTYKNIKHKRKVLHRKSRTKQQRKRKRHHFSSHSSDSDVSICGDDLRDLKGKLKEAVHINEFEGAHKNPLEARLKGMGGIISNEVVPQPPEPPKITSSDNLDNLDKIDDNELENLRIEALKTAVLNKCQQRKKKKALLEGQKDESKPDGTLDNKENDTPKDEIHVIEKDVVNTATNNNSNNALDLEEDEDILRASLLAGLAKKITKTQSPSNTDLIKTKQVTHPLPVKITPVLPKHPMKNFTNTVIVNKKLIQNRPKPQVKPLIIKVNDDSDSDEEVNQKPPNIGPSIADLKVITNSVEKFLKEQRAKFETETKKRFQIVNKNKSKGILEKSAVKLLPKSQQIEYQQLLKRLKNAERRKKLAKKMALQKATLSSTNVKQKSLNPPTTEPQVSSMTQPHLTTEISLEQPTFEINPQKNEATSPVKVEVVQPIIEVKSAEVTPKSDTSSSASKDNDTGEKKKSGIINELTTLQRTLKEIKMQRNGSLQIKSKYQVLTSIIRKITATSNDRKKQEQRIKNLLEELSEARKNLAKSHERFSTLVRELVDKKEKIDKSCQESQTINTKKVNGNIINKTMRKSIGKNDDDNNHEKDKTIKNDLISVPPVTSTPIKTQTNYGIIEEATISTIITNSTNNDCEDMDVCNSDEPDMCQIDIVDPNDIDQIFKRKSIIKSTIPEYVSPLNLNTYERYRHVDPLGIMCPYEINGLCRDTDCTFKHYLKN